ncbi:phosphoglucomutase (alpha-D-glucose-1,6-bisphosphate-dependent) [Malassezia vespertilionis]|uniref:phosphoglucomutase (alpha-D-glucose-1,6-bisphosphate-dependent) n=1 Tax=Malassezia vespertilionis TaxID=2020962 RepID=UPI0024B24C99|nr:phosphoglucomutase (alpha-D-glucose-1,6-bisphosphate-dependent) [Malassezia vespertilionis]WFD07650.1 phosphoglucomutase (alpha-D-glucose-1,6-bisphosphate-dependent) [Malassezia vespertilionis]
MTVQRVATKPFEGQKPGTSGLRKRVKVFEQEHYTENFVQAILDAIPDGPKGSTLLVGGDGRYFSEPAVQTIIRICAGNGVNKLIVGQNGILSTPAASHVIRQRKATGGILLTASHNPGGPDADFGIKYNTKNGGPAPESVTDKIFELTKSLDHYFLVDGPDVDIAAQGTKRHGEMDIEVIDSVKDYVDYLAQIFDFDMIRSFLGNGDFSVRFDALHGVTGPYAEAIFLDRLGLGKNAVQNTLPLPDFGGGHPDPNLTYAKSLVNAVEKEQLSFGAASDGDGDRNMILGKGAFVNPSDSVAIIADWAERVIPYFKGGIRGLARSMPTSGAIDRVAKAHNYEFFEVPTGWKFFGNLMDAERLSICGEESFGTGSDHIREKDGLWAVVAWLSILAAANKEKPGTSVHDVLQAHYNKYGRNFFSRYDYEEVSSDNAAKMMDALRSKSETPTFIGSQLGAFKVAEAADFSYVDPIDGSVSKHQGLYVCFDDGSRIIFRLSGTGSMGATIRLYVEKYTHDPSEYNADVQVALKPLIHEALTLSALQQWTGRNAPTVIT